MHLEKFREQRTRRLRHVRTCSVFNLRKVRLAEAFALRHLLADRPHEFLLRQRTPQSAQRPFHLSEVPNFLAQLHPASITDCDIYIAICNLCQDLYRPCFEELRRTSREDNKKAPGFWSGGRHGFPLISPTSQHQAE